MFYSIPSPESYLLISAEDKRKNAEVDVTRWVKKMQGLDYLAWGISKSLLHAYNPMLEVGFDTDPETGHPYFATERGVYLLAYIFDKASGKRTASMFYPVRNNKRQSDASVGMDTIGNQMQRAYSKVIAQETGLGWSLYSRLDESIDLDEQPATPAFKPQAAASSANVKQFVKQPMSKAASHNDSDW